ncbi:hypothetical protein [Micromonospora inyonensis]|uniref:Uncharacterized protein n=1 Tax=Micromonospora inyonensis TaxID=47866 RepID=A0A1C6RWY0_9ACTN|nr:hypothetical protein [Micromonospora inyonensis]SCL21696.1 hypothetical protein GA0074694_3116 [Micromonospora inyonensis]
MPMYATPEELASYLQQDLDEPAATLALTLASGDFARAADAAFSPTTATWTVQGGPGTNIEIPYRPVTEISQVRLNGNVITGWTLRHNALWRSAGFGTWYAFPPDVVEVDLTYGYTTVPDDVKKAVLEIAAGMYEHPGDAASESIDDYTVRYNGKPITAGRPWSEVAADYRGILIA